MLGLVIEHGGWILIPIALTSIAALGVAIERALRLFPLSAAIERDRQALLQALALGGADSAREEADADRPLGRVVKAMLVDHELGSEAMRRTALDAAQREVIHCERGLGVLLAASQVAPLFGLLGTVVGLIEAFQGASTADHISAGVLSGGIYKALTTTVAGLLVAIPTYLFYAYFSGLVARIAQGLERSVSDLVRAASRK
jgi:biopolymer transport protein ExbB